MFTFNQLPLSKPIFKMAHCLMIVLLITHYNAVAQTKGGKWESPKSADNIKNPITSDATSLKEAKSTYTMYCSPCHGEKGKGDGIAAAGLTVKPADHSSATVQAKSDGALYWEMTEGHNPMPSYKTGLSEKQRWQLVNYIRTLAKKTKH